MLEEVFYSCYKENPFRMSCIGEFNSFLEADNAFHKKIAPDRIKNGSMLLSTYKILPEFLKQAHLRNQYLSNIKTNFETIDTLNMKKSY